jgi:hypothetical protein
MDVFAFRQFPFPLEVLMAVDHLDAAKGFVQPLEEGGFVLGRHRCAPSVQHESPNTESTQAAAAEGTAAAAG